MDFRESIKSFIPFNEQEINDKAAFIDFIESVPDCLLRENIAGHVTVSAWIVNSTYDRVLFCYHNIYDSWSWTGGHADGNACLSDVALKEAYEETGLTAELVSENIFSLEILPVAGHIKKGVYVPSHIHYNVTYLLKADESAALRIAPDENSGLRWLPFSEIPLASTEKWMVEKVYAKLVEKVSEVMSEVGIRNSEDVKTN